MVLRLRPGAAGPGTAVPVAACFLALALLAFAHRAQGSPPPESPAHAPDAADALTAVVDSLQGAWQYVDALIVGTRQLEVRAVSLGLDDPRTLESWKRVGLLLHWSGNYGRARIVLRTGLDLARARLSPHDPLVGGFHHAIGLVLKDQARRGDAMERYREAERILLQSGSGPSSALASLYSSMASVHRLDGRFDEAERLLRQSFDMTRELYGEDSVELAVARTWLGWFLMNRGRYHEAENELRQGVAVLDVRDHGSSRLREAYGFLARSRLLRGDRAGADSLFAAREYIPGPRIEPMSLSYGLRVGTAGSVIPVMKLAAGDVEGLWDRVEGESGLVSRRFVLLSELERRSPHASELRESGNAVLEAERDIAPWIRAAGRANLEDLEEDSPNAGRVLDLLVSDARRLGLEEAMLEEADSDGGRSAAEVQQAMHPGEAIVGYRIATAGKTGKTSVYAFVLCAQGPVHWVDLGTMRKAVYRDWFRPIADFRELLFRDSAWPTRLPSSPQMDALRRTVWDRMIGPIAEHLDGVSHLVITGWPPAVQVPVEALRDPEGNDLIDRFTVSYAPSASVFAALRNRPSRTTPSPRALLVGAPAFNEAQPVSATGETAAVAPGFLEPTLVRSLLDGDAGLDRLPALPLAVEELRSVAGSLSQPTVLLGADASEEGMETLRVEGRLADYDIIHVATHALLDDGRIPERSSLALSRPAPVPREDGLDGLISAQEIYLGWELNADLVTLSACQTAGGASGKAGEYMGFLPALLRAGARSLVCSQWKVDDMATRMLMERFYGNLRGGRDGGERVLSKSKALSRAKRWLRDYRAPDGTAPFCHPVYWAGFVLIGNPD